MKDSVNRPPQNWSEWQGWPYVLVGLAVILRIIHIWNSRANPTFWAPAVDPGWYDKTAQDITSGNWGPFPFFRAPAYPALLAIIYSVFGRDLMAARLLNIILQGICVWAVWRVGRAYFKPAVGIIAAFLLAVNGMAIYFTGEILSTSMEMLAAILGFWAIARLTRERTLKSIVLCGLTWGIAAIVRPNFLFVFPAVFLSVYILSRDTNRQWFSRKSLLSAAVWLAAALIPILPVTAVNYFKSGELVLIATQGGVNFWIGNNPESTGILSVLPGYGNTWTMDDAQAEADRELGRSVKAGELSSFYYSKGWTFLKKQPLLSLRFMIRKTALFFNQFEISNNKHISYYARLSPWLPPLLNFNFGFLVPFALLGIWVTWKQSTARIAFSLIVLYMISVILFFVTSRFRMPVIPYLSLFAAAGCWWIVELLKNRAPQKAFAPLLVLIPGILLAHINLWDLTEAPIGWARYMDGNAYMNLNQLDSARTCFLDAIRDQQAVGRAQLNLGVIALRQGDTTKALEWYELSRESEPANADVWNNLGAVYEWRGDTANATEAYRRALELRPSAADPRHNLAGMHFRLGLRALKDGHDSLAIQHLNTCISLEPTAVSHYDIAIAYWRLKHREQAVFHLERALQFDPRMAEAQRLKDILNRAMTRSPESVSVPQGKNLN